MAKRSTDVEVATTPAALSQNINLFQSLRVLQEGENSEDASALSNSEYTNCIIIIVNIKTYYMLIGITSSRNFFQILYSLYPLL